MVQAMIRKGEDSGDLEIVDIEGKGQGVLAGREFAKGEYVCEYAGDLIDKKEAERREAAYRSEAAKEGRQEIMCYMYFLKHAGKEYW